MVQKRTVNRIDIAFVGLEVIAGLQIFRDRALLFRNRKKLVVRQERWLAVTHISENHSSSLLTRICFVTNRIPNILSSSGLSGHVDDLTVNVIQPAMIDASEPANLDTPVAEIGAPVGAMKSEQARDAL